MSKQIVTIFGATGKQGGGAVKYLCSDGTFHVRAVTRNPESDASKALVALGAEVVKADMNDKESLVKAMKGVYGVFGVTDFWSADGREEIHGRNLVDAAKETGVQHFVYSTLDRSELNVPHWETKANVNDYLIASGVPRTSLYTAAFFESLVTMPVFGLKRDTDGSLLFDHPVATDGPTICISGQDCGVLAGVALKNPEKYIGKDIQATTQVTTFREIVKVFEEVVGEKIKIKEISMEEFDKLRGTVWDEAWLNMKWFYLYWERRDVAGTIAMLPKVRTLKDIIAEYGGKATLLPK